MKRLLAVTLFALCTLVACKGEERPADPAGTVKLPDPPEGGSAAGAWFCCPELKGSDDCVLAVDTCPDKLMWCEKVGVEDDGTKVCDQWAESEAAPAAPGPENAAKK